MTFYKKPAFFMTERQIQICIDKKRAHREILNKQYHHNVS